MKNENRKNTTNNIEISPTKMKRIVTTILCIALGMCTLMAEVVPGKTYRIVPAGDETKSLFVENASWKDKSPVRLWTETDVPAQQWRAKSLGTAGKLAFENVYTGKYLNISEDKAVQTTSAYYWAMTELDDKANIYTLKNFTKLLSKGDGTHGSQPIATTSAGNQAATSWQFIEVEEQPTFTVEMRDRMAQGFLGQYLQSKGVALRTFIEGGWGESETMEAVLDMYQQTGDEQYWNTYNYCYRYFKEKVGDKWTGGTLNGGYHWYGYDFNDDVMWQIIGAARASVLTGNTKFLEDARRNFDAIYERANLGYVELLRWAESTGDRNGTNSCINGPAEVAACYIGIAAADESYFETARRLYANQRKYLFEPSTGQVYDAVVLDPANGSIKSRNTWASTYNQGTMLGAATLLYQHYGDAQYKQDADRIIDYAMRNLCDEQGIVKVCQNADGDFQGFKGILMRYAGLYARTFNEETVRTWLIKNAFHAYNNMNSRHYGHSAWLTKSAEDDHYGDVDYSHQAFGASTALSAAFAIEIPDSNNESDKIKPVATPQQQNKPTEKRYDLNGRKLGRTKGRAAKPSLVIKKGEKVVEN